MDNLSQAMTFKQQLGRNAPPNWSDQDTPLKNFTPLNEWVGLIFDTDYKIVGFNNYFLVNSRITSIDLSGLSSLTTIGNNFLYKCKSLTSINLSGLSNLQNIGIGFLHQCEGLTSIDLSGLSRLTTIGKGFLYRCKGLTSINLSGLSKLQNIGKGFLYECKGLTSINLSRLSNLTTIEEFFLASCSSLTTIDLSVLSNVTTIESYFLGACSSLTSIDLSGLSNVTTIESYFLGACSSLTSIDLSGLSELTTIGENFLYGCKGLTAIDLSGLSNLKYIRRKFLRKCSSLTSINLSGLSNLTTIGIDFLAECNSLTTINFSGLPKNYHNLIRQRLPSNIQIKYIRLKYSDWEPNDRTYNIDKNEFCITDHPNSIGNLKDIHNYFDIHYAENATKDDLCANLQNEFREQNERYTEEEIAEKCNDTDDLISGDPLISIPKRNLIQTKTSIEGKFACYDKQPLKEWCIENTKGTMTNCKNPLTNILLTQSEIDELINFNTKNNDYNAYFKK